MGRTDPSIECGGEYEVWSVEESVGCGGEYGVWRRV